MSLPPDDCKFWQRKPRRTDKEIADAQGNWWLCPVCGDNRVTPGGDLRCPNKSCSEHFKLIIDPEKHLAELCKENVRILPKYHSRKLLLDAAKKAASHSKPKFGKPTGRR